MIYHWSIQLNNGQIHFWQMAASFVVFSVFLRHIVFILGELFIAMFLFIAAIEIIKIKFKKFMQNSSLMILLIVRNYNIFHHTNTYRRRLFPLSLSLPCSFSLLNRFPPFKSPTSESLRPLSAALHLILPIRDHISLVQSALYNSFFLVLRMT